MSAPPAATAATATDAKIVEKKVEGRREWIRDDRGHIIAQGKERFGISPIAIIDDDSNDMGRSTSKRVDYLEGVRGFLGLQTLLWIFFRLFAPAIVTDTGLIGNRPATFMENSPNWMTIIRKVLSPLLFDGSLQMTCFIVLMGRASLQTYTERREAITLAGQCARRPVRLVIPTACALALASVVSVAGGFSHVEWLSNRLQNDVLFAPPVWESTVLYVNSMVTLIMAPITLKLSRAVLSLPPAGVSWFIAVMFQQTYVLAVLGWTIPYTILRYKAIGGLVLVVLSAWIARWSWYTITGLLICEFSVLHRQMLPEDQAFYLRLPRRIKLFRLPYLIIPLSLLLLGTFFKYLWIAILPSKYNNEYAFHADINTAKLLRNINPSAEAYPRYDDWLVATGLFILLELSPKVRSFFSYKPLVFAGRLSFSIVLISGTVMMSLGSLFYQYLVEQAGITSLGTLTFIMFIIMIPLSLLFSFIWWFLVDEASIRFSHLFFRYLTKETLL